MHVPLFVATLLIGMWSKTMFEVHQLNITGFLYYVHRTIRRTVMCGRKSTGSSVLVFLGVSASLNSNFAPKIIDILFFLCY